MFRYCWEKWSNQQYLNWLFGLPRFFFVNIFWVVILLWYEFRKLLTINLLYIFPLTPKEEICLLGGVPGSQVKPGRDGALERSFFHEMMVPCPNIVQIQGHVYLGSCRAMIFWIHTWWSCVHWADPHGIFCRLAGIEGTSDKLLLFLKKVVPSTPCSLPQSD